MTERDPTTIMDLAVSRGLMSREQADAARDLTADQLVERGLIDRRELDTLMKLAGGPRVLFGRYEVIDEIGRGGMGVVYRCRDRKLDRIVALKGMSGAFGGDADRFEREARTAARLHHPNITAVHDFGHERDEYYLTMDCIAGQSFERRMSAMDSAQIAAVFVQIARALHYAHLQGVVHRDVKPDNILVDDRGHATLTDFGLARRIEGDVRLTVSGVIMGTPPYMSPEQAVGGKVGPTSDLYSLGTSLFHALTGVLPHQGQNAMEIAIDVLERDPPPIRKVKSSLPGDLETIVLKATAREPGRRYADGAAMADDLERFLRGEPVLASRPSLLYRVRRGVMRRPALTASILLGMTAVGVVTALLVPLWREAARGEAEKRARSWIDRGRGHLDQLNLLLSTSGWKEDEAEALAKRARDAYAAALEEVAEHPEALLGIARAHALRGRVEVALEYADRAVRADPSFGPARLERALIRLDATEAIAHREEADPKTLAAAYAQVEEDLRLAGGSGPEQTYAEGLQAFAAGDFERAASRIRVYLQSNASDPRGWFWLAECWTHAGDHPDEVFEAAARAIELRPRAAGAYLARGLAYEFLGRYPEAYKDFERATELEPRNPMTWANRGNARLGRGDAAGAIEDFTQSIEIDPTYAGAYSNRGSARQQQGDLEGAVRDQTLAIERAPRMAEAWLNRGNAHALMRRYPEAIADYDEAERIDPGKVDAITYRGQVRYFSGDVEGAIRDYDRAIDVEPEFVAPWFMRGNARQKKGEWARALEDYSRAIEIVPRYADAYLNRGNVKLQLGETESAIEDYTKVVELRGDWPLGYDNRGQVRGLIGDHAGAAEDFRRALELTAPEDPNRATLEARLAAALEADSDF